MQEKLVEHWLTNANELTYQIPFCEVLVARGHTILHVSTHGRGEHGKDVVSRSPRGTLYTFQLKGGDIALSDWREIRGEVEELVRLPVRLAGVNESEPHQPFLVTNGVIRGDAHENIVRFRDEWERTGAPRLRVITRGRLLNLFLSAHAKYLPTGLLEFRTFVELFVADFRDRPPRQKLATLLGGLVPRVERPRSATTATRSLAAVAVIAGYVAEQYERAENHIGAAETWTIAAATVLGVAERDSLDRSVYGPVLELLGVAVDRNLDRFISELFQRAHLLEGAHPITEPLVYGARVSLCFGWLAVAAHRSQLTGRSWPDRRAVRTLIKREFPALRFCGEVDWPTVLLLGLYAERLDNLATHEALLELWVRYILTNAQPDRGVPSPYWLHERVIARANGILAPGEQEDFGTHTYTLPQALDMLVRRLRRQLVAGVWQRASKLHWCDFVPDALYEYFSWHTDNGSLANSSPPLGASWSGWRAKSGVVSVDAVPRMLRRHPEWLPPFLMTYPHRANRTMTAFADASIGRTIRMAETAAAENGSS